MRRTDYLSFIEERFRGSGVDEKFFLFCIEEFLREDPGSVFLVTSDDIDWCKEHLTHQRILFPTFPNTTLQPAVLDFTLLTQTNHSIYDYGSFAFWGAVLAGGRTRLAGGYSRVQHSILQSLHRYPIQDWTVVDVKSIVS